MILSENGRNLLHECQTASFSSHHHTEHTVPCNRYMRSQLGIYH